VESGGIPARAGHVCQPHEPARVSLGKSEEKEVAAENRQHRDDEA
jgi:hypothetical protein